MIRKGYLLILSAFLFLSCNQNNDYVKKLEDPELFHGIRALGGAEVGFITKILAMPSTILRDTVTRDPGFVFVNVL